MNFETVMRKSHVVTLADGEARAVYEELRSLDFDTASSPSLCKLYTHLELALYSLVRE